jgi:hypothetical protein
MTALSTNYGAPSQKMATPTPSAARTGQSEKGYSLSSLSKKSRAAGSSDGKKIQPITRWDRVEHRAAVELGDQYSVESHDSRQMIISKNMEWAVEYEGQDRVP